MWVLMPGSSFTAVGTYSQQDLGTLKPLVLFLQFFRVPSLKLTYPKGWPIFREALWFKPSSGMTCRFCYMSAN